MKKIASFFALVSICIASFAQSGSSNTPFLTKSLKGESFGKINVETSHGDISVSLAQAGEPRVEVYVHSNDHEVILSKEAIKKLFNDDYTMEISVTGDQLNAIVRQKNITLNLKPGLRISFVVFVPKAASTTLRTSHGNINISSMKGVQDLVTSHGNLTLDNISGKITGQTSHGDISISNSDDVIDLITSHGNITLKSATGKITGHTSHGDILISDSKNDIDLRTSHGNIVVKNTKGKIHASTDHGDVSGNNVEGNLSATTSHGDVRFHNLSGSIETSTNHGNIAASFDEINGNTLIDNSKGDIALQLPKGKGINLDLKGRKVDANGLENLSGSQQNNSITGTLNGGGEQVKAKTGKGTVSLTMK